MLDLISSCRTLRLQRHPPQTACIHSGRATRMVLSSGNREGPVAKEYHTNDYSWAALAERAKAVVQRQEQLGRVALAAAGLEPGEAALLAMTTAASPAHASVTHAEDMQAVAERAVSHAAASSSSSLHNSTGGEHVRSTCCSLQGVAVAEQERGVTEAEPAGLSRRQVKRAQRKAAQQAEGRSRSAGPGKPDATFKGGDSWDEFYASTARSARFFKERRYILLEFPALSQQQPPLHIVELGCGYGASLMPVLKTNPTARVTATDVAPTCVAQLSEVAMREGISDAGKRITSFVADSADPGARHHFLGLDADIALIMFTLSAVPPSGQAAMLANAYAALRPGGLLCIRDHGLYDMVQLRIPAEQWVGPNMYKRGDGTLAYFYSVEDMRSKGEAAGFQTLECEYVTVYSTNRKSGLKLERVFVHAVFKRPDDS